ncbi:HET-domain-containing protein [Leucogyrophana mollusca]|uniref:HET-domain-containing protein n=1 Tax=Leucogyrophana mollusca TaxID=85980 RepID=A0ACB8AYN9_9AGAM|nr:HET-domain-containing protein [Leucogyrophana mollusca]
MTGPDIRRTEGWWRRNFWWSSRISSWASSIGGKLLGWCRRFSRAFQERFARNAKQAPIPAPAHISNRPKISGHQIHQDSPHVPTKTPKANVDNGTTSIVSSSSSTLPGVQKISVTTQIEKHSKYLQPIRQQGQQPTTGPINVKLQVSRSGGITLSIQAGETGNQRLGELAIVPCDDVETPTAGASPDAKFSFPIQSSYDNAQIAKSLASEASFSLAQEWLRQCLQQHHNCTEAARAARTSSTPSRLIDVGGDSGAVPRLVTTQELNQVGLEYLTLSHCWGGADILRLLVENINSLTIGIPMSTLPNTFRDAILITRRLGYQYLWIDSLCIIQNSPSDWRSSSAIMGEIYANSICTIAALTARNSHEGCFFDHARNPLFFRPCRIRDNWYVRANSNVGIDLRVGLSPLPLHTRAWVVQERILAPRTVYYGSTGLAWECVDCSATETVLRGEVSRFSPKASFFGIQKQPDEDKYDAWSAIRISYTQCLLTRFSDRLVAISGVIKRLEMLTGWQNVWGLWKEHLLMDMLWYFDEPARGIPETDGYLAPTWSWMGVEGKVMMALGVRGRRGWAAEVVEVGSVGDRGFVRLRAMMKKVKCTAEWGLNPGIETPAPKWEEVSWDPDVKPTTDRAGEEMGCVLLARLPEYIGGSDLDMGLVLAPKGGDWVRVGMFRQLREGNALFPQHLLDFTELSIS